MPQVITRFAPSPTGYLHIGGARTALFNWLYARHTGGKFLLRIEDTDQARSTQEAMDALLKGMEWLGLDWDDAPIYQSKQAHRHMEVAQQLLDSGKAYHCYTSQEELTAFRQANPHQKFRSPYRDGKTPPTDGTLPVVRLRAPMEGEITVHDLLKGTVSVDAKEMDDMVLLRADGTPTYMLAVVVDDHDMGVTHAIRGNDHFTNKFRQLLIYDAMGWAPPKFAHVPLILGEDGTKLSKRHGATGLDEYEAMGFLPDAMRNYLLRLGWSHGDQEIFSDAEAIKLFDFDGLGKSPSRFDVEKLKHVNQHYMRSMDAEQLLQFMSPRSLFTTASGEHGNILIKALPWLIERASTITELCEQAAFLVAPRPLLMDEKAQGLLTDEARSTLNAFAEKLADVTAKEQSDCGSPNSNHVTLDCHGADAPRNDAERSWNAENLHSLGKEFMASAELKPKFFMPPLRAALSGKGASAGTVFQIMEALGKEETLGRIGDVAPSG